MQGVENLAVARVLNEIADLLELKGENPFRVRAYRTGAQVVADCPGSVADLTDADLLALPGVGKDLAARIREIRPPAPPPTIGSSSVSSRRPFSIYSPARRRAENRRAHLQRLKIATLEELEAAARGRAAQLKGMGAKKEELILKAIAERRRTRGGISSASATLAEALIEWLREAAPGGDPRYRRQPATGRGDHRRHRHPRDRRAGRADGSLHALPARRARARAGRHEVERASLEGVSRPICASSPPVARRRAAVLHRLEGAQHRAPPARAVARASR